MTGRYGFDGNHIANLEATALTWSGVLVGDVESRVTVDGKFSGSGTLERPTGRGDFTFAGKKLSGKVTRPCTPAK